MKKSALAVAVAGFSSRTASAFTPRAESVRGPGTLRKIPTVCAMCAANCLIVGTVRDGRLVKIEGNPGNPLNGPTVCARGQAAMHLLYDPDRLKYPLKRVGPRGSGKWTRITWGEAIDTISLRMERALLRDGPESLALFAKGPSSRYVRELFAEFAVPSINDSSQEHCALNRDLAYTLTFGAPPGGWERLDYRNTDCVVLLGGHLGENVWVPELRRLNEALGRGARLIVADPRFSAIANKADYHLMLRPGSDTALLLGWINYLIETGRYDVGHVADHVEGFGALRQQASRFPLDKVAAITGLAVGDISRTAMLMAQSAPAIIIHPGNHSNWYGTDVQRLRAQAILTGLLGAWGARGGIIPSLSSFEQGNKAVKAAVNDRQTRAAGIFKRMRSGAVKVMGCWGQNPLQGYPSPYKTIEAFLKADFIFACDVLPGETARYADIVLPEASFLERTDVVESWSATDTAGVAVRFPVVAPRFEAKDPYWIVKQLSVRLGRGAGFAFAGVEERLEHDLRPFGTTLAALRRQNGFLTFDVEQPGEGASPTFSTMSGKIEFSSKFLAGKGHSPVPEYEAAPEPPAGFFRLLYGRSPVHGNGTTWNNVFLHNEMAENVLWLNKKVADGLGLRDGQRVFLENRDGIRSFTAVRVKATPGIRPDCVYMVHGFGSRSSSLHLAFDQGVSDTALMTRSTLNQLTATRALRNTFVRLVREPGDA